MNNNIYHEVWENTFTFSELGTETIESQERKSSVQEEIIGEWGKNLKEFYILLVSKVIPYYVESSLKIVNQPHFTM